MARIKTFQGSGPNPNVPFAGDMPRPQFIGQQSNAVSNLANNIGKEAINYMNMQKQQNDASEVARADADKMLYQAELDGSPEMYDEKGNINLDWYGDRMNDFYDGMQTTMSSDAYQKWSNTQKVLDARRTSSFMSENMKRTREFNRQSTIMSLDVLGSNSLTGSFEDMQDATILIKKNIDNAVGSGILDLSEAVKYEDTAFKKLSKSYIENLKESVSAYGTPSASIHNAFDKANEFVNADPYNVYSRDEGLRNGTRQKIALDRLEAIQNQQNEFLKVEGLKDRTRTQIQNNNFDQLKMEGFQLLTVQEDPTALIAHYNRIKQLEKSDQLTSSQASNLINMNVNMINSIDDQLVNTVALLRNDDEAAKYIGRITDPKKRDQALKINRLTPEKKSLLTNLVNIDKSRGAEIINDYTSKQQAFGVVSKANPNLVYDNDDMYAVYMYKYYNGDMTNKAFRDFSIQYGRKVRAKFPDGNVVLRDRLRTLLNQIEDQYELEQQQRGR